MRRLAALGCLLLTLFLTGCTGETFTPNADVKPAGSELTVWFVSDLHLLSEELTDYSPEFLAMIARGRRQARPIFPGDRTGAGMADHLPARGGAPRCAAGSGGSHLQRGKAQP